MKYKMNPELKHAWDEVLFWARRCSYNAAATHPEWQTKYREAKKKLEQLKLSQPIKEETL